MKSLKFALALALLASTPALAGDAYAYIIEPIDGATVTSPVKIVFGLSGAGVAPAGIEKANTGHHHLLVDMAELPDLTQPLPSNDNVRHFGGGQTETEITLEPGTHTLQLILGDHLHTPHNPPVKSDQITITVAVPAEE
ncbi:MAG: DUF4399 domain-containing protein [bacterium]